MIRKCSSNQRGIVLAEVLLTVVIFAVGITVVVRGMLQSYRASVASERYLRGSALMEHQVLEWIFLSAQPREGDARDFDPVDDELRYQVRVTPWTQQGLPSGVVDHVTIELVASGDSGVPFLQMETLLFAKEDDVQ